MQDKKKKCLENHIKKMFKNLKEENKNLFKIYEPIMKTIKRSFYQLE